MLIRRHFCLSRSWDYACSVSCLSLTALAQCSAARSKGYFRLGHIRTPVMQCRLILILLAGLRAVYHTLLQAYT